MRIKYLKKIFFPKTCLKAKYRKNLGRTPDLKNPKRYTELLQWRKLYDQNPLYTKCSDKLAVREYVKDRVGEDVLIPLICSARHWDELDFQSLPESFIIKATHGSGWNEIVYKKSEIDESVLRRTCENWLVKNYYHGLLEWQYKDIPPRLVVEKLLLGQNGKPPEDYKCHCFNINGDIEVIISVNENRFVDHRRSAYDEDWNRLPYATKVPPPDRDFPCPENLDEILRVAKKLAEAFNYVRVDLYEIKGRIYFAELTFTPDAGLAIFKPDEWDFIFGAKAIEAGIMNGDTRKAS